MVTLSNATVRQESQESILFQPVLKAYPITYSWIITAHVSLANLKKQWRMFVQQMGITQQLLNSLQQKSLAPTYTLSALQAELTHLDSIYTSYKPLILMATQLLSREPTFNGISPFNRHTRRSLLPFLGGVLSWLTGITTPKDARSIKNRVNQLIAMQHWQQETTTYYLHFKCYQVCHSGEQATHQPSDGCSRKDTSGWHQTLQHHHFTLHQPELPADCTSHPLHSGKPKRFTILYETSGHACDGLHRHSYNWYTITSCTLSRRSLENVNTH